MKELAGSPIDDDSYELLVLQGLRALLGDERAQKAMVDQQNDSAAASEQIMAEAQARYDALTSEQREAPEKTRERVKVRELAGKLISGNRYELLVLQGLQALLGDDEAQREMIGLQSTNPAACEQVMAEAQARYDTLTPEQREDPKKILEQVAANVVKLNVEFKFKTLGKSIKKITILSIIRSIPKVLKSLFIKQ